MILFRYNYFFILFFSFLSLDCSGEKKIINSFNNRASQIMNKHIPDKSLSVFRASLNKIKGKWIIEGETNNATAYSNLLQLTDSLFQSKRITNNLLMLPDSALGDSNYAIVNVSVTPLREKPKHSSQMVDQAIMGNIIKLLRYHNGWYLSQTHYDYVGWINQTGLLLCDSIGKNNWLKSANYFITDLQTSIYSLPDVTSQPIGDAVLNNVLIGNKENMSWISVFLPDGRSGYIFKNSLKPFDHNAKIITTTDDILYDARRMTGVPYLWGGNSTKGNDCSGFTQIVFKANGIQLPRDARQQANQGIKIIPNEDWSNIFPGDLLFFGKKDRVTHVGISTGKKDFIHQGGMVAINSLDEKSKNFSPKRLKTFLYIKRIIES